MRMRRDWLYTAALPDDPGAPGAGGEGGGGGAPAGDPPAGDPPANDPPEITWESLSEKGIKSPADVIKALGDVETWKGHARTWEGRATASKAELDKLQRAGLPDNERAAAERDDRVRAEERAKLAPTLGAAAFATAAAGKVASVQDALELIDPARFVKDDGTVDDAKVQAAVERFAKLTGGGAGQNGAGGGGKPPAVERGPRNGDKPQLSRADLERMSPEQINAARKDGRLDDLLGIKR